ncbi:toxin VasX [Pseudozobellia thermophila]|uniref:Toxin VasX N-terminal region domain-containing protein n=1 Tax=Pseudozobellia thermophila TaxID=192903 RepID=A0A1M6PGP1_9FLAO|nr:toxin VasX [Pseudozobellia thermophila]SHK07060.1 hypothetical protein SAMN04488513_12113 [Pseudozobellia thermophila]
MSNTQTKKESRKRVLTLEVECGGRTFDFSSQKLQLTPEDEPIIKLHFLRFGKLSNEPKESHLVARISTDDNEVKKDENGRISLDEVIISTPKQENFSTIRTGLNPGYLYIIDETRPNIPIEFEIDQSGNFASVSWEKGGEGFPDIRITDGKNNTNGYYEAELGAIVWVAYSSVQWSKEYYDGLVSDTKKRKERMIKVQANGFPLETAENASDYKPYDRVVTYFSSAREDLCKSIQGKIDGIQQQEEKRQKNRDEKPNHKEPEVLTDMFVTLDDPIGNANEIATELATEIIRHRAILESMQTASNVDKIYQRMLSGGKPEKLSEEKEQINAMFNLALTTYQLVYNNEDMIDDYDGGSRIGWGRGIYKQKLLDVLGVEERKIQRKKVNGLRDDLGNFIDSDFYKNAYIDHVNGSVLNIVDGKYTIMQHLRLLAINPHDIDRTLDLRDEYEKNDKWDKLIEDSLKEGEDNSYKAVLNKEATVDEEIIKQGIDVSNKMADFAIASLEAYAKYALKDVVKVESYIELKKVPVQGRYKLTLNRMNTINLKTKGPDGGKVKLYQVRNKEIVQKLGDKGMKLDRSKDILGFYGGKNKDVVRFKTNTPEIVLMESSRGNHIFDVPVIQEVEREITQYRTITTKAPTRLARRAGTLLNGTPFRGVVALLQVFNVTAAYDSFSSQENKKNGIALAGVSFELLAASAYFSKSILTKHLSSSSTKLISRLALGAEIAGMGVTVIICGWEALESHGRRDQDAMWAWIGASAAFSVATVATIMGSSSVLGPYGWIAAGIGVGLVFLAYYLKDSPLEAYFKHFAFSDEKALDKNPAELTWRYNQRFYNSRTELIGDTDNEYQRYIDFKLAAAELTDLIVCADIRLTPRKVVNQKEEYIQSYSRHTVGTTIKEGDIKEFTATISFRQFFNDPSQLSYEVHYYQKGVLNGRGIKLDIDSAVTRKKGTKEKPPQAIINFEIPDHFLVGNNKNSQILFVCYLDIGEGKYYPNRHDGLERYIGVIAGVNQLKSETIASMNVTNMNHTYHSNVRVSTLENLKSGYAWKK